MIDMAYCFMSTEKIKSLGAFTRKYEHNYRTANVPNADKSRAHLNEELIKLPEGMNYTDAFRKKMLELGHTPRSNAVLGIEIVMTYNATEVPDDFDIDKWKELNIKWLKENFPEDGILSVVMHRDEGIDNGKAAHIHAVVLPLYEGKLNCKHYLSGRKKLIDLQNSYGKAMEEVGLERGLQGSSAKHESIRRFYDSLNKTFRKADEVLPLPNKGEDIMDYYQRIKPAIETALLHEFGEKKKMERKIDELKTQVKMATYEAKIGMKKDIETAKKAREKAEAELKKIEEKKKEMEQREEKIKNDEAKYRDLRLLSEGLANHPDANFSESLRKDIQEMIEWEENYEKQLEKIDEIENDIITEVL